MSTYHPPLAFYYMNKMRTILNSVHPTVPENTIHQCLAVSKGSRNVHVVLQDDGHDKRDLFMTRLLDFHHLY